VRYLDKHKLLNILITSEEVKEDVIGRVCSTLVGDEKFIQSEAEKTEWKKPLVRPRSRWEDNIKVDDTECEGVDWIQMAHDRAQWRTFVNTVINLLVS
jgi:hypothetical protein